MRHRRTILMREKDRKREEDVWKVKQSLVMSKGGK